MWILGSHDKALKKKPAIVRIAGFNNN